jgi:hypothetical protein
VVAPPSGESTRWWFCRREWVTEGQAQRTRERRHDGTTLRSQPRSCWLVTRSRSGGVTGGARRPYGTAAARGRLASVRRFQRGDFQKGEVRLAETRTSVTRCGFCERATVPYTDVTAPCSGDPRISSNNRQISMCAEHCRWRTVARLLVDAACRVRSGDARHENGAPRLSPRWEEVVHGNHLCTTAPAGGPD